MQEENIASKTKGRRCNDRFNDWFPFIYIHLKIDAFLHENNIIACAICIDPSFIHCSEWDLCSDLQFKAQGVAMQRSINY